MDFWVFILHLNFLLEPQHLLLISPYLACSENSWVIPSRPFVSKASSAYRYFCWLRWEKNYRHHWQERKWKINFAEDTQRIGPSNLRAGNCFWKDIWLWTAQCNPATDGLHGTRQRIISSSHNCRKYFNYRKNYFYKSKFPRENKWINGISKLARVI